ncbi:MAG TPA: right-handed parallel beta-helix repeat-containing protein [Gemmatimonadaceae bacterium]|nr:right-handed parallel beta-helix repeat-containing protein [Gemmatimonadaceae bacterium]
MALPGASYEVAPGGSPDGDGSAAQPWDLAFALSGARGRLQPGDTVWLRGGRYVGSFKTSLTALPERHIVFRAWPGERATIDGTLRADGAFLTFWGFEITQADPVRSNTYGLQARTRGGRFINLVIHDAGTMGVSFWSPAEDAELYGCIIYSNGTHENLDHGVYVHNERGRKLVADNVLFNNLAYGIHLFAGRNNAPQRDVRIEGNILFNNGTISRRYRAKGNIIVGGSVPMSGMEVLNNVLYYSSGLGGENLRLGYDSVPNGAAVVRGNHLWGGATALRWEAWAGARVEQNVLGGARRAVAGPALDGNNTLHEAPGPGGATVFLRPNRYEDGRAFLAVHNWARAPSVAVDLTGVLRVGQRYEIRNVQDVFGPPVAHGIHDGDPVRLTMAGVTPPRPVGRSAGAPTRTAPAFDVFLVTMVSADSGPSGRSR